MLDQITEQVFIGKARLAYQPDMLRERGIKTVVKLFESPPDWPPGFRVIDRPIPDGEQLASETLQQFDDLITKAVDAGESVIVVCGAGISRSATIILSYLVASGMPIEKAYPLLKNQHPQSEPHPELLLSLIDHHALPYGLTELRRLGVVED